MRNYYPLDIDPVQVVRWVMVEHQAAASRLRILARRASEVRDVPPRRELHLGDQEREDLSEVDTIATLEIAPAHASEGWLLTVEVEDEAGPRLPERGPPLEGEGQIDLRTFYDEFMRPGRGVANVVEGWRMTRPKCASTSSSAASKMIATLLPQASRHAKSWSRISQRGCA